MNDEIRQQLNEKLELSLNEIFNLNPEIKEVLHLHAAERYYKWLAEVWDEIAKLTTEENIDLITDINTYLSDDDKAQLIKHIQNILDWLHKCTNIARGYSPYPYDRWITSDMSNFKLLMKKAYSARPSCIKSRTFSLSFSLTNSQDNSPSRKQQASLIKPQSLFGSSP